MQACRQHWLASSRVRKRDTKVGGTNIAFDEALLLSVLRKIESRGAIETARRIKLRVAAIYRYANAQGAKLENPAAGSNDALKPLHQHHDR